MNGKGERLVAWHAPPDVAGERLDRHVAGHLDAPRNRVQAWIRGGRVWVDGRERKGSHALRGGEAIECRVPAAVEDPRVDPEAGELAILYEDPRIAVIDKPAGLAVHPGAGRRSGTLAHRLLARYPEIEGVGGPGRPGIVHRLDKDTSGVLVVARTGEAHRRLAAAFAARAVDKRYVAVVYGVPDRPEGVIEAPIARHPARRKEMAVRRGGRPARTGWRVVARGPGISLLELRLETGRTHQIRVHLKSLGHPLVGDPVYGEARWRSLPRKVQRPLAAFPRPALHAWRLAFDHPGSGERVEFEAPVPADLRALWEEVAGAPFPEVRAERP